MDQRRAKIQIRAKICKNITGPMIMQKFEVMKYRNIWKDLEMADGFRGHDGKYDVDILIGNDYYDDIVKAEKIKIETKVFIWLILLLDGCSLAEL